VGNRGVIGPGDVQWMTAARGIIHEEFHSTEFAKSGGKGTSQPPLPPSPRVYLSLFATSLSWKRCVGGFVKSVNAL
jgi:hypothetical protein